MDDQRTNRKRDSVTTGRVGRALACGFRGIFVGFFAVGIGLTAIDWLASGKYDQTAGGAVFMVGFLFGCPIGFALGAIFGLLKPERKE